MELEKLKKKIYARIEELPTLPAVIPKIIKLMENPDCDTGDITEAISHDPALTSKILKVANSAYYGFPQKITSLDRAVALLGFNMVKSLALSVGVIRCLPKNHSSVNFTAKGLWIHSLAVATVLKGLAERAEMSGESEAFFVIGLLHDIGKLVLNEFFQDSFQLALSQVAQDGSRELWKVEMELIGLDHGQVGGILLKRWKFPESIRLPIAFHHSPEQWEVEYERHIVLLNIADCLAREIGFGGAGNPPVPGMIEEYIKKANVPPMVLDELKKELEHSKDGIYGFFEAVS